MWKNKVVKSKNIIRFISTIFVIFFLLINVMAVSNAAKCSWEDDVFKDLDWRSNFSLSIVETITNSGVSGIVRFIPYVVAGNKLDTIQKCAYKEAGANVSGCEIEDKDCAFMEGGYGEDTTNSEGYNYRNNGSLLGLGNMLEKAGNEPLPVNLAFFVNKQVEKIPFFGTALADTDTESNYSGPLLKYVYIVWKVARNIALGFMAIVILVVGIMIITRKSISAQASVTVQMALPRIIIAMVLIIFSYPIGAVGASLAYNLRGGTEPIVAQIKEGFTEGSKWADKNSIGGFSVGIILLLGVALMVTSNAAGPVILVVILGCIVVIIVLHVLVYLKMFGVYMKILMAVITAPFTFAIGSIPGNEDTTIKWFKRLASCVITIPAMFLIIDIGWNLAQIIALEAIFSGSFVGGLGYLAGPVMGVLLFPMIPMFSLNFARSLPEKIDGVIVGDQKRR